MTRSNLNITPDRHNAIQSLNYYDLPDPRHFSLPSAFNVNVGEELGKNKTKNLRPAPSQHWQLARKKCRVKIHYLIPVLRGVVFSNLFFLMLRPQMMKTTSSLDQSRQSIQKVAILSSV
jgi:hypothetical protein